MTTLFLASNETNLQTRVAGREAYWRHSRIDTGLVLIRHPEFPPRRLNVPMSESWGFLFNRDEYGLDLRDSLTNSQLP
jgi:hypothetical protein